MGIYNYAGAGLSLVLDGDSQSAGTESWFAQMGRMAGNLAAQKYNFAVPGKTAAQCLSGYASPGATPAYDVGAGRQFSPAARGGRGVYFLYAGINDLGSGATGSATFAALSATWASARADGYERVVAFTIPQWLGLSAGAEAERAALITAISWAAAGYDVLVDLDRLFPNKWAEVFNTAQHLSATGQAILARHVWGLLNGGEVYRHYVLAEIVGGWTVADTALAPVGNWGAVQDVAGLLENANAVRCPVAGVVRVAVNLLHNAVSPSDVWKVDLAQNGEPAKLLSYEAAGGAYRMQGGVAEVVVAAGDVLQVRVECTTQSGESTIYTGANSHWSVEYLPGGRWT